MKVLLTNDDGIQATGLQEFRKALLAIDGIELDVIAPDGNRSATARSITTRSPLWVQEIEFPDGGIGYATDGTPVDCVRFADLGLLGHKPDLVVSGINHGSNLGDDVTYSGTVAAAFEGLLLGLPAIAVSQQALDGTFDFRAGRDYDFRMTARFAARLTEYVIANGLPDGTLINVNAPGGEAQGIEVTKLGKRLYDDELKLVEQSEQDGRKRYQIYGFEPSFEDLPGTDLAAVARKKIAITPIHFDLTDHGEMETVSGWDLDGVLEKAAW